MLPLNTNIREAYACGQDQEQNFIQNLAMFLCTYLKEHGALVEKKQLNDVLMKVRKLYCFGTV
jgi:exportin-1